MHAFLRGNIKIAHTQKLITIMLKLEIKQKIIKKNNNYESDWYNTHLIKLKQNSKLLTLKMEFLGSKWQNVERHPMHYHVYQIKKYLYCFITLDA